jgi:hypothetical protein
MHEQTYITPSDLRALAKIDQWATDTAKVARVVPTLDGGDEIVFGHARYFCIPDSGNLGDDGATLRVTTQGGWESFWPLATLVEEVKAGTFTDYDWSN